MRGVIVQRNTLFSQVFIGQIVQDKVDASHLARNAPWYPHRIPVGRTCKQKQSYLAQNVST